VRVVSAIEHGLWPCGGTGEGMDADSARDGG
jgi:lysyl-tRNA synthetase class II